LITFPLLPFLFQAEDGILPFPVTGVQTCALPISGLRATRDGHHSKNLNDEATRHHRDSYGPGSIAATLSLRHIARAGFRADADGASETETRRWRPMQ